MAKTKYVIDLCEEEKSRLNGIIKNGVESDRSILRAKILLASDISSPVKLSVTKLAEALETTHTTIQTVRTAYAAGGIDQAVYRKERTVLKVNRRINDDAVAKILELHSQEPPAGYKKWSLRLLCRASVEAGIVEKIAPTTMMKVLARENEKI